MESRRESKYYTLRYYFSQACVTQERGSGGIGPSQAFLRQAVVADSVASMLVGDGVKEARNYQARERSFRDGG